MHKYVCMRACLCVLYVCMYVCMSQCMYLSVKVFFQRTRGCLSILFVQLLSKIVFCVVFDKDQLSLWNLIQFLTSGSFEPGS
jgi:hypothetical protein